MYSAKKKTTNSHHVVPHSHLIIYKKLRELGINIFQPVVLLCVYCAAIRKVVIFVRVVRQPGKVGSLTSALFGKFLPFSS